MNAQDSLTFLSRSADFVELVDGPVWRIDLRYAGLNNFARRDLYGAFNRAFLHRIAAEKLEAAGRALKSRFPEFRFIVFDAVRPKSVQAVLWDEVVGTVGQKYFADPAVGSMHSYGFAVDLSVLDETGRELDMGAGFDDFRDIAEPRLESEFLHSGELKPEHLDNRLILREAMVGAGFAQLPHEWWHFDALPRSEVRDRYRMID